MDRGFENWQMVTLLSRGETVREIPVENGVKEAVRVQAAADVSAPVGINSWPDIRIDLPDQLPAGIEKGREVGTISLLDQGEILVTVPLLAAETVAETDFRHHVTRLIRSWPLAE